MIHPIAGRCKHCKGDLSALRSTRPAAAATLPSLLATGAPQNPYVGGAVPAGPAAQLHAQQQAAAPPSPQYAPQVPRVHPANAHLAVPIAMRTDDEAQPILPPRPTGRMAAAQQHGAAWRSWPVIVIAIAVVAIVTAVVLMVWPPGGTTRANAGTLAPPPAPERMDTNPMPGPQGSLDPWNNRPGAAPDPAPTRPQLPSSPDIDDIDPDPDSLANPFRGGGNSLGSLGGSGMLGLFSAVLSRACDRLASCPNASSVTRMACTSMRQTLPQSAAPTCAAAQRCMASLDRVMTCDDNLDPTVVLGLMNGMQDCAEAMRC